MLLKIILCKKVVEGSADRFNKGMLIRYKYVISSSSKQNSYSQFCHGELVVYHRIHVRLNGPINCGKGNLVDVLMHTSTDVLSKWREIDLKGGAFSG